MQDYKSLIGALNCRRTHDAPEAAGVRERGDAFGVSLDYLVGEGINASFDKKTLQRLQEIENMDPDFKKHLFSIIDSVIRNYKTQQAYA